MKIPAGTGLWCCLLIANMTMIMMSLIMYCRSLAAIRLTTVSLDVVKQIYTDWAVVPFVDIVVV